EGSTVITAVARPRSAAATASAAAVVVLPTPPVPTQTTRRCWSSAASAWVSGRIVDETALEAASDGRQRARVDARAADLVQRQRRDAEGAAQASALALGLAARRDLESRRGEQRLV